VIDLLQNSPFYLLACCFLFGLIIGSFLNVVVYRLPIMMERDFKEQALWYLNNLKNKSNLSEKSNDTFYKGNNEKAADEQEEKTFNLIIPNSTCPHCSHEIKPIENIPVISFLFLRGKCSACKIPISFRYPIIELFTAFISALLAWHFGFSWQLLAALIFTYALICQSLIDWDTQYLLDDITFPMLWLGLLLNSQNLFVSLDNAVMGAIVGYMSLWTVFWTYKLITGKEGMGQGDFKLLAMLGAWMGWQFIPLIILLSSVTGSVIGSATIIFNKNTGSDKPISFGPYLAVAGWISFLWGEQIINSYLGFIRF
jgi:leader peptidase (prepilin peptidase)/N-methyltransferase